jgi:menaquinone-dependent protoporphyrinogen IX oxidase
MKVWIVHDSRTGNGEMLAKTMGKTFEKDMEVNIAHVKETDPAKVVADSPDIVVVGAAVRAFTTSLISRNWIRKMHKELKNTNKTVKIGATFLTHAMPESWIFGRGKRLNKLLARSSNVTQVYSECIYGRVAGTEGPFEDDVLGKVEKHAAEILKLSKKK